MRPSFPLLLGLLAACSGDKDTGTPKDQADADADTDSDTDTDTDTDTDSDTDTDTGEPLPTTATVSGGWSCANGVSCQDVYEVELTAGAEVEIEVEGVTGASLVRLAAFRPGEALSADNVLVGTSKDLSCTGQDEDAEATFIADVDGTWRIAVGRDWGYSAGAEGEYTLTVRSPQGLRLNPAPVIDDGASEAQGMRCGSEYVIEGTWNCQGGESCQDSFALDLPFGMELSVSVTDVTGYSIPRLALHAPGVGLGGVNLLTNTLNDRMCVGQDSNDVLAPYPVEPAGVYTLAVGRDWNYSSGASGTYRLTVAGDDFFARPSPGVDDVNSLAPDRQCDWTATLPGGWDCLVGESCQDVYDLEITAGAAVTTVVSAVTGASVVRLAAFAPGEPLSGVNLMTGTNQDHMCGGQDIATASPPFLTPSQGVYRLAVGRDWGNSAGSSGTYEATFIISGGYGGTVFPTVDDQNSQAAGVVCIY